MSCLRESFTPGTCLDGGRYQTVAPLNHGSFGMVFMARDTTTNDLVAVKCLTKKSAPVDAGLDFVVDDKSEELALHGRLGSHPNIVNLKRCFETESHLYLVLEFCPRGDLYEAIRNGQGPLETEHVRRFMLELVDAVAYMHAKGIYHRDIKPENIFLTESGSVKLGDFGLATTEHWTFESTVGSDRYMSPEQYDSAGAGYSPAQADIWAIGVCLLNVLFSRNPFTTPTEADPLFLDFSRDKQSLFDVFPSMSQDTYEVIVQCMNLDPRKRSLVGARAALCRAVCFTTLDEALDDFCTNERKAGATSNREPLRTPSIQSPTLEQGPFPWPKALQDVRGRPMSRLSAIPDNESYSEDLFPKSEESGDWFSGAAQTPSMSSMLGSHLGDSMKSLAMSRPRAIPPPAAPRVSPTAGSLPIAMAKPRTLATHSAFGGRQEMMSKSWSDMWEEDMEQEKELAEQERELESLKAARNRGWTREDDKTITGARRIPLSNRGTNVPAPVDMPVADIDGDFVPDGFFFHDSVPAKSAGISPRYSPPTRRGNVDKWAALGERRRAYTGTSESSERSPEAARTRRPSGPGHHSSGVGVLDGLYGSQRWAKDRAKECPWNKGRDWTWNWNWRKRADFGDVEWVGGWQEA